MGSTVHAPRQPEGHRRPRGQQIVILQRREQKRRRRDCEPAHEQVAPQPVPARPDLPLPPRTNRRRDEKRPRQEEHQMLQPKDEERHPAVVRRVALVDDVPELLVDELIVQEPGEAHGHHRVPRDQDGQKREDSGGLPEAFPHTGRVWGCRHASSPATARGYSAPWRPFVQAPSPMQTQAPNSQRRARLGS